ncbi:MAG: hypothetical protein WB678_02345 [Stellaceae bacterium]
MKRFSVVLIAWSALLAGCAGATPGTPASSAQAPGPGCSACIEENPGDLSPCVAICHAPLSDSAGRNAGGVIH